MPSAETILETFELSKRFGKRWAVRDLHLKVNRGDVFGFLGPNGAGKSTTIRMILTLLRPTSGTVQIFGMDLHKHRASVLSRVSGMVESAAFYLYLSAYKNLDILGSMTRQVNKDEILEALALVGLKSRAYDKVGTFSHGMKQRLGLAQALLTRPELIILDEPTSGLDPQGMKEVRELIRGISEDGRTTVFLSSHLLSEVEEVATRMAVINRGRLIAQGDVAELLGEGGEAYTLHVSPPGPARELIGALDWVEIVSADGGLLELRLQGDRSAELNRFLVEKGIEVSSLSPHRTLENFFLKITEGVSEI